MDLPLDLRKAPFKPKYLDEETPMLADWFAFGEDIEDGTAMIGDGNADVLVGVPQRKVAPILEARQRFVAEMVHIINGDTTP